MANLTHPKGRTVVVPDETAEYYLSRGWAVADGASPAASDIPDGDPSEEWTAKQLDAVAERDGVDLGGATKKADKVAAILAARA